MVPHKHNVIARQLRAVATIARKPSDENTKRPAPQHLYLLSVKVCRIFFNSTRTICKHITLFFFFVVPHNRYVCKYKYARVTDYSTIPNEPYSKTVVCIIFCLDIKSLHAILLAVAQTHTGDVWHAYERAIVWAHTHIMINICFYSIVERQISWTHAETHTHTHTFTLTYSMHSPVRDQSMAFRMRYGMGQRKSVSPEWYTYTQAECLSIIHVSRMHALRLRNRGNSNKFKDCIGYRGIPKV